MVRRLVWEVISFTPFQQCHSFASKLHKNGGALIDRLLKQCGPSAIVRCIVAVVVNAVDRMIWRRRQTHICQEIIKQLPSVTHFNAAAAVIRVGRFFRVIATFFYSLPYLINRRSRASVSASNLDGSFQSQTPTRLRVTIAKARACHLSQLPTFTFAPPLNVTKTIASGKSQNRQAPKYLSGRNVFEVMVGGLRGENQIPNGKMMLRHMTSTVGCVFRLGRGVSALRRAVSILPQGVAA